MTRRLACEAGGFFNVGLQMRHVSVLKKVQNNEPE